MIVLAFPDVCDALTASLGQALGVDAVFDGPPPRLVGLAGLAVGATRQDVSSDFTADPADLGGATTESIVIACLAWSADGRVVFKPHRDAVRAIVVAAEEQLAADRTLGGVVDTCDVTGGTWMQEQTGEGALVTCEFRISVRRF